MQSTAVSKHGVDKGVRKVEATAGGPEHSLNELTNLALAQDDCRQLTSPTTCDEYPAWLIYPNLLDVRIVEEWLQWAIPSERRQQDASNLVVPLSVLFTREALVNDTLHTSRIRHRVNTRIE
jgi:hypothetical protein